MAPIGCDVQVQNVVDGVEHANRDVHILKHGRHSIVVVVLPAVRVGWLAVSKFPHPFILSQRNDTCVTSALNLFSDFCLVLCEIIESIVAAWV